MLAAALVVGATLALPGAALAVHWPHFGGDGGRSGYQPVDEGGIPIPFSYAKTEPNDLNIKTSIVTSAGAPAEQVVAYGTLQVVVPPDTQNPNRSWVRVRRLADGELVASLDIDDGPTDDTDTFTGAGAGGSVSFVDTSTAGGPGLLFVVHNDTDQGVGNDDIEM